MAAWSQSFKPAPDDKPFATRIVILISLIEPPFEFAEIAKLLGT